MARVAINHDDLYPFYHLREADPGYSDLEVPDDKLADWERVMNEFERVQEEMAHWPGVPTGDGTGGRLIRWPDGTEAIIFGDFTPMRPGWKFVDKPDEITAEELARWSKGESIKQIRG